MNRKNELLARVYIVMMFFVFLSVWIIGKVFFVNVIEGEKWKKKIEANVKWKVIEGDRGNIYAADGNILAASSPLFDIRLDLLSPTDANFKKNIDSLSLLLSKYIRPDKSARQWKTELTNGRRDGMANKKKGMRFYLLKRNVKYEELMKMKKFPLFRLGQVRGGFIVERKTTRIKPFKEMAGRTIGIDRQNSDNIGLEGAYDQYLKGEVIRSLMKKMPGGYWLPMEEIDNISLTRGADIITNIDIKIQDIVHEEILKKLNETNSEAGVGIVMDVKTGKILAMTNLSKNSKGGYAEIKNYALTEKYAPGSVMKIATALALLDDGYMDSDDLVDVENGRKNFRGDIVRDDENFGHGKPISFKNAIVHSSNVAMAKLSDKFYNRDVTTRQHFIAKLKELGLGNVSGIDIDGEVEPVLKDPLRNKDSWHLNTIPWMAHGYEIEFTPIQLLTFFNAIANNGKMVKPYLVDKIARHDETIEISPEVVKDKIASDSALIKIKDFMLGVVQEGTATKLKDIGVKIAGKTGTAQIGIKKEGEDVFYNSTFAGYFPAENPKYSMIVVLYKNSKSMYYASQVSVPVFGEIVKKILSLQVLDVAIEDSKIDNWSVTQLPGYVTGYTKDFKNIFDYTSLPYKSGNNNQWSAVEENGNKMVMKNYNVRTTSVPDVRGMGARDAVFILENLGMKVKMDGFGKVVRQSVEPNSKINTQTVYLTLN